MKKIAIVYVLLCCIATSVFYTRMKEPGFLSAFANGDVSGKGGRNLPGGALFLTMPADFISSPLQAILLIPMYFSVQKTNEKIKKQKEAWKILVPRIDEIKQNPQRILKEDYLAKDHDSLEYGALIHMIQDSRNIEFSASLYDYIFKNSNLEEHRTVFIWTLRNYFIPEDYIVRQYNRMFNQDYPDTSYYMSLIRHPKLPRDLLFKALQHRNVDVVKNTRTYLRLMKIQQNDEANMEPCRVNAPLHIRP